MRRKSSQAVSRRPGLSDSRLQARQGQGQASAKAPLLQAVRHQLALGVVLLFACVCVGMLLAADAAPFERIMPFVAAPLTLVLNYYFGRREKE